MQREWTCGVPNEEWEDLVHSIRREENMEAQGEYIRTLGGLHIIGTERHEARRIDLQLRGRSGRWETHRCGLWHQRVRDGVNPAPIVAMVWETRRYSTAIGAAAAAQHKTCANAAG